VLRGADSEAKQSIKKGRDSQLLLPAADLEVQRKKGKAKWSFTISVKTPKGQRRKLLRKVLQEYCIHLPACSQLT
jgi:hypothetical protein